MYFSTSSSLQRASGETLTFCFFSSQPDDRRDHPVVGLGSAQPGRPCVVAGESVGEGLDLAQRAAQVGVALVEVLAVRRILLGHGLGRGDGEQVDRHRRLRPRHGCRSSRRSGSRCRGRRRRCPGAPARRGGASTASAIEDVTQKRSPKVATAHSMMSSAGASSSSAPTWETSSSSSSGLRPTVSEPRRLAGGHGGGDGHRRASLPGRGRRRSQLTDHADLEDAEAVAAFPRARGPPGRAGTGSPRRSRGSGTGRLARS